MNAQPLELNVKCVEQFALDNLEEFSLTSLSRHTKKPLIILLSNNLVISSKTQRN